MIGKRRQRDAKSGGNPSRKGRCGPLVATEIGVRPAVREVRELFLSKMYLFGGHMGVPYIITRRRRRLCRLGNGYITQARVNGLRRVMHMEAQAPLPLFLQWCTCVLLKGKTSEPSARAFRSSSPPNSSLIEKDSDDFCPKAFNST